MLPAAIISGADSSSLRVNPLGEHVTPFSGTLAKSYFSRDWNDSAKIQTRAKICQTRDRKLTRHHNTSN